MIETDRKPFFTLTKRIHNMIHGVGNGGFGDEDRQRFELVGSDNAKELRKRVSPEDILVVHDPQPIVLGALLKHELGVTTVWNCVTRPPCGAKQPGTP